MRFLLTRTAAQHVLLRDLGLSLYEAQLVMDRAWHEAFSACLSTGAKLAYTAGDGFVIYGYGQHGEDIALYRQYAREQSGEAEVTFTATSDGRLMARLDGHLVEASARGAQPQDGDTWVVLPIERPVFGRLIVRLVRLVSAGAAAEMVDEQSQAAETANVPATTHAFASEQVDALIIALSGRPVLVDRSFSRDYHLALRGDPTLARRKCKSAANRKARRWINRLLNHNDWRGVTRFGRPLGTNRGDLI